MSEIGRFIENFVQNKGFFIVPELGGHGIGYKPHEKPFIFNFYNVENQYKLSENEIIAIEPIISTKKIKEMKTNLAIHIMTQKVLFLAILNTHS